MSNHLETTQRGDDVAITTLRTYIFDHRVPSEASAISDRYQLQKQRLFKENSGPVHLHWNTWFREGLGMTQILQADPYLLSRIGRLLSTSFGAVYAELTSNMGQLRNAFKATAPDDYWLNPIRHVSMPFEALCKEGIQTEIDDFMEGYRISYPDDRSLILFDRLELEMGKLNSALARKRKVETLCLQWSGFFRILDHDDPISNNVEIVCGMYAEKELDTRSSVISDPDSTVGSDTSGYRAPTSANLTSIPQVPDLGALVDLSGVFGPQSLQALPDDGYDTDDTIADLQNHTPPTTAAPSEAASSEPSQF